MTDCIIALNSDGNGHEDAGRDGNMAQSFTQCVENVREWIVGE